MNLRKLIVVLFTLVFAQVHAANWHADGTGRYPDTNPPTQWCAVPGSASKNVIWNRPLPSWTNSSPLIMGDRVFVCGEPTSLICLNLTDGAILWQREHELIDTLTANEKAELAKVREQDGPILKSIHELIKQRDILEKEVVSADRKKERDEKILKLRAEVATIEKQNEAILKVSRNYTKRMTSSYTHRPELIGSTGYSTPSPVGDGKYVYVLYHNGVVAAYDLNGNRKWMRYVGHSTAHYGQIASPVVVGDRVIVHLTGLTALNTATGETVWHIDAPRDTGHNTPIQMRIGGTDILVMPYGEVVSVADGSKCSFNGVPSYKSYWNSPVVENDTVYFNWHPTTWAGRVSLSPNGKVKTDVLWKEGIGKGGEIYPSPVVLDGLLYCMLDLGQFIVTEAATGKRVYEANLGRVGMVYPSLVAVGGHIYAGGDAGTVVVIKAGREYKEVARNPTEPFQSTLVFHNNRIYIRTMKGVLCIGEK